LRASAKLDPLACGERQPSTIVFDALLRTINEQLANRSVIRGASPHVATQHHGYFIVIRQFFPITLRSHPALIVQCKMTS
jgi:hypothetical protein